MKVKKKVKEYVPCTHFELTLKNKDKEVFKKVLEWLMESGVHSYQWESTFEDNDYEYILTIQTCWADNLGHIASLLGDFGQY